MAILERLTKKKAPAKKTTKVVKEESSTEAKASVASARAADFAGVLLKPHVSEKAAMKADKGVYIFDVPVSVNKVEVRKAVEAIYGVKVLAVRTQRGIGKVVRRGRTAGRRNAWKKALVELKPGQTLSLIEGV
ncbi:MAG: 50S ribosomal protein L23 [Candidatus Uhrbacteria bacterium]|nr:50S ribosomal protein L23 [Candidatus Uhrbacteria bacterium]